MNYKYLKKIIRDSPNKKNLEFIPTILVVHNIHTTINIVIKH